MTNLITKRQLRTALSADEASEPSDADLARWFGISQSAVSQWDEDAPIPRLRALELAVRRPDLVGRLQLPTASDPDLGRIVPLEEIS